MGVGKAGTVKVMQRPQVGEEETWMGAWPWGSGSGRRREAECRKQEGAVQSFWAPRGSPASPLRVNTLHTVSWSLPEPRACCLLEQILVQCNQGFQGDYGGQPSPGPYLESHLPPGGRCPPSRGLAMRAGEGGGYGFLCLQA